MEFDRDGDKRVRTVDVATRERHAFSLTDEEVVELARYAVTIEQHYGRPMDIEWGKDGRRRDLHPAGAARDGEVAIERQSSNVFA